MKIVKLFAWSLVAFILVYFGKSVWDWNTVPVAIEMIVTSKSWYRDCILQGHEDRAYLRGAYDDGISPVWPDELTGECIDTSRRESYVLQLVTTRNQDKIGRECHLDQSLWESYQVGQTMTLVFPNSGPIPCEAL